MAIQGWAQDTTTQTKLVILADYDPVLSAARKVVIRPVLEPLSNETPTYTYDLPNFGYKVMPTYQPARAIELKIDELDALTGNYFKLGGGNYLTPYGEFQLQSLRNKKFSYGAYGKHLSSNAGNPKNADFSDNELGIFGTKLTRKGDLTGKLNYERHVIHRYGYNEDSITFEKAAINQIYNDFNGSIAYDNGTIRKKTAFKTIFDFYTFSNLGNRENDFQIKLNSGYDLRHNQLIKLDAAVDFTSLYQDTFNLNRMFIRVKPSYTFQYKKIDIRIGANAVVVNDTSKAKVYVFPDVSAEHFLVKDKVKVFAEIGGDVRKTSLRQLSYLNPFVVGRPELVNTINNFNAGAGIRGILKNRLDYLLKVQFSNDNNLALFKTDSSATHPFNVAYDNVQTVAFQTGLGVRIDEKFFVQFATTLYNYKTDKELQAWQLPSFDADINLRYTLAKKLNLRLQMYAFGERFQRDIYNENNSIKIKPFADVNLIADYRYKENISFFLQAHNLSNSRYQKWYNYPVYGVNVLAGVTFSL